VLVLAVLNDGRWKLAAHTVTPLDVTTVARCCRQTQYVLHPAECHQQHGKHHSDSGQQVSSLHYIALEVSTACLSPVRVFPFIRPRVDCFTGVTENVSDDTVQRISSVPC
jgi:hypothetical protein